MFPCLSVTSSARAQQVLLVRLQPPPFCHFSLHRSPHCCAKSTRLASIPSHQTQPPTESSRSFFLVFFPPFFFRLSRQLYPDTAVGKGGQPRVEHVHEAPQQRNGFDCGMYTVLLAERLASKATAAATPTPLLMEVEAGAGPGSASVPRENQPPLQDKEAVLAAGGRASVGSGGGIGGGIGGGSDGDGGARDGVSRVAAGTGSGDAAAADAATIMISPEFVSNARNLAMDRLLGCIRNQG